MKFCCPYCKHIFTTTAQHSTCPKCKKAMNIPDYLKKTQFKERKKAKEKIRRDAEKRRRELTLGDAPTLGRKATTLLFVLACMIIVGGMLIGRANNKFKPTPQLKPESIALKDLNVLRMAVEGFNAQCGRYPRTDEGLTALIINPGEPNWKFKFINKLRKDPWQHEYVYKYENNKVMMFSKGPDGIENTSDDIIPEKEAENLDNLDNYIDKNRKIYQPPDASVSANVKPRG